MGRPTPRRAGGGRPTSCPTWSRTTSYRQLDFNKPVRESAAIRSIVKGYLCPSDTRRRAAFAVPDAFGTPSPRRRRRSYAACCGGDESGTDRRDGPGHLLPQQPDARSPTSPTGRATRSWRGTRLVQRQRHLGRGRSTRRLPARPAEPLSGQRGRLLSRGDPGRCSTRTSTTPRPTPTAGWTTPPVATRAGRTSRSPTAPCDSSEACRAITRTAVTPPDGMIFQAMGTRANGEVAPNDY